NGEQILAALADRTLRGVVVGGVELADLPDPQAARDALAAADVVISLEVRTSEVTELADVVLPVAPPSEKAGAFWNWEGRVRVFRQALESHFMPDHRVLDSIAREMGVELGLASGEQVRKEIDTLDLWDGARTAAPAVGTSEPPAV